MKTRKARGRRGSTATGGSRAHLQRDRENTRPARYEPPPAVIALLQSTWSKRLLLSDKQRELVFSLLRQAHERPLSDRQLDVAAKIGASVQVGFDDPRLDDPSPPTRSVQPWGPLPLRPPGRS